MATHTPAQAIQELVNHTAVLTERLVGLQQEVRKGMSMTPEWGNALTQVVGDTKRMLQAMEHLARLPAFHLDREGLNAAVAAGVQQGLAANSGSSLTSMIESNTKLLEDARTELAESKKRMDQMMEEMQVTKEMTPESRQKFFMQFAPIVGMWSVGLLLAGLMMGRGCSASPTTPSVSQQPPAISGQQNPGTSLQRYSAGQEIALSQDTPIYRQPATGERPAFTGPRGLKMTITSIRSDGWIQVAFATPRGRETGWLAPDSLR